MTVQPTPLWSSSMAAVWRNVCGLTRLHTNDGQVADASRGVLAYDPFDSIAAEAPLAVAREHWLVRGAGPFREPLSQRLGAVAAQRRRPILAALAAAPDMRLARGTEDHVADVQTDQLRDSQSGLQGDKQQIPVAPAYRCGQVGHREQCGGLLAFEEVDRAFGLALCRDGEHPLAMQQERRFADGDEAEEAADCGSAHIACADGVLAVVLDEGQEPGDETRIDVGDRQIGGLPRELPGGVGEQEAEGVAVACHGVRTGFALGDEPVGEEALHERRQGGMGFTGLHDVSLL